MLRAEQDQTDESVDVQADDAASNNNSLISGPRSESAVFLPSSRQGMNESKG